MTVIHRTDRTALDEALVPWQVRFRAYERVSELTNAGTVYVHRPVLFELLGGRYELHAGGRAVFCCLPTPSPRNFEESSG